MEKVDLPAGHYVYIWTCTVNGKRYVGKGKGGRAWQHMHPRRQGGCRAFHGAIRKHGADKFSLGFVAAGLDTATASSVERCFIAMYGTRGTEYNLTDGGEGTSGLKLSPDQVANLSQRAAGWFAIPENRAAHKASMASPESKARRRAARVAWLSDPQNKARLQATLEKERPRMLRAYLEKEQPKWDALVHSFPGVGAAGYAKANHVSSRRLVRELRLAGWRMVGTGRWAKWVRPQTEDLA